MMKQLKVSFFAGLLFLAAAPLATADLKQQIVVDTHNLIGQGSFSLAFQLSDASMSGDANNSVVLSGFDFMGGMTGLAEDQVYGGATGSLASEVHLVDSDGMFNALVQGFSPGRGISFYATFSNNLDGFFPDLFAMSILDSSGMGIPTLDPAGNDTFMTVPFDGSLVDGAIGSHFPGYFYASDPSRTNFDISAPVAVPEPWSLALFATVAGALGLRRKLRK